MNIYELSLKDSVEDYFNHSKVIILSARNVDEITELIWEYKEDIVDKYNIKVIGTTTEEESKVFAIEDFINHYIAY